MSGKKLILILSSFFAQFSINMVNFALIYYMRDSYQLSATAIGVVTSIYTFTYIAGCLLLKKPLEPLKRKNKAIISLMGMAITALVVILQSSFAVLCFMQALYGLFMSLLWPNVEAWLSYGLEGNALSKIMGQFSFAWSFGAALSTFIGGWLAEINQVIPLALGTLLFCTLSALLATIKDEGRGTVEVKKTEVIEDHSTKLRYFCYLGVMITYALYALIVNIFPLYASASFGYDEGITGTMLLSRGLVSCLSFLLLAKINWWQFNKAVIVMTQVCVCLLLILFSKMTSVLGFCVFFILFGFVFALSYQLSIFHGAAGAPSDKREGRMVTHEVALNIGMISASLSGGIIYEKLSFSLILYIFASISLLLALIDTICFLTKAQA